MSPPHASLTADVCVRVLSVRVQRDTSNKRRIQDLLDIVNRDPLADMDDQGKQLVWYMRWVVGPLGLCAEAAERVRTCTTPEVANVCVPDVSV